VRGAAANVATAPMLMCRVHAELVERDCPKASAVERSTAKVPASNPPIDQERMYVRLRHQDYP
jgi:hypothetical protein